MGYVAKLCMIIITGICEHRVFIVGATKKHIQFRSQLQCFTADLEDLLEQVHCAN